MVFQNHRHRFLSGDLPWGPYHQRLQCSHHNYSKKVKINTKTWKHLDQISLAHFFISTAHMVAHTLKMQTRSLLKWHLSKHCIVASLLHCSSLPWLHPIHLKLNNTSKQTQNQKCFSFLTWRLAKSSESLDSYPALSPGKSWR